MKSYFHTIVNRFRGDSDVLHQQLHPPSIREAHSETSTADFGVENEFSFTELPKRPQRERNVGRENDRGFGQESVPTVAEEEKISPPVFHPIQRIIHHDILRPQEIFPEKQTDKLTQGNKEIGDDLFPQTGKGVAENPILPSHPPDTQHLLPKRKFSPSPKKYVTDAQGDMEITQENEMQRQKIAQPQAEVNIQHNSSPQLKPQPSNRIQAPPMRTPSPTRIKPQSTAVEPLISAAKPQNQQQVLHIGNIQIEILPPAKPQLLSKPHIPTQQRQPQAPRRTSPPQSPLRFGLKQL